MPCYRICGVKQMGSGMHHKYTKLGVPGFDSSVSGMYTCSGMVLQPL